MDLKETSLSPKEMELLTKAHEKAKLKIILTTIGFIALTIIFMTIPLKFLPKRRAHLNTSDIDLTLLEYTGLTTFIILFIIFAIVIGLAIIFESRIIKINRDLKDHVKIRIKSTITEMICIEGEYTALIEPVNDVKRIQLGNKNYSLKEGDNIEIDVFRHSHLLIDFVKNES